MKMNSELRILPGCPSARLRVAGTSDQGGCMFRFRLCAFPMPTAREFVTSLGLKLDQLRQIDSCQDGGKPPRAQRATKHATCLYKINIPRSNSSRRHVTSRYRHQVRTNKSSSSRLHNLRSHETLQICLRTKQPFKPSTQHLTGHQFQRGRRGRSPRH